MLGRAGGWQKSAWSSRCEWFGRIPKFIITGCRLPREQCNDLEFCALVEHELYHIAQATDDYGAEVQQRDWDAGSQASRP